MDRNDVTELIVTTRLSKGLKWSDVADAVGYSKEWVTAACLGQMAFSATQAQTVAELFELPAEALALLTTAPYRGSLPTAVPTDPLIYRFYELVNVYGTTLKELDRRGVRGRDHERDRLRHGPSREPNPAGDRVRIVMSGKFLAYKTY